MSLLAQIPPTSTAAEYDALAPHYDAFTDDARYDGWIRRLEALARRHGLTGRRALDLGCGTGSSLLPLTRLGYDAVGCDVSAAMLQRAACKLPAGVELVVSDLCALPELGCFDLVWSVNDTVNYLVAPAELRRAR